MIRIIAILALSLWVWLLHVADVNQQRTIAALRAIPACEVVHTPPESKCAAWLFNTNVAGAKARLCGGKR